MEKIILPKKELESLVNYKFSVSQIAEHFGCWKGLALRELRVNGLEANRKSPKHKICISKNLLITKYIKERKSANEIAKELGLNCGDVVMGRLKDCGIKIRSLSEAQLAAWDRGIYSDRNSPKGDKHHWYSGGNSNSDGIVWYQEARWVKIRDSVRGRDNNVCKNCFSDGKSDILGRLYVHHILPRRYYDVISDSHDLENLILFCNHCHSIADGNFPDFSEKQGEFRESLKRKLVMVTLSQAEKEISRKVQRLENESYYFKNKERSSENLAILKFIVKHLKIEDNNFSTSSLPERDDIVRAA